MQDLLSAVFKSINHIRAAFELFTSQENYDDSEFLDFKLFMSNLQKFSEISEESKYSESLYSIKGRQMILADLIEYMFLGRIYYGLNSRDEKSNFIKAILYYVNLLMGLETLTVSSTLRTKYLDMLKEKIPSIENEPLFDELYQFRGKIGLSRNITEGSTKLNRYFDSLLPKTAGGLWHELLVYIYILRSNLGYIIPLLLTQRFLCLEDHLVPPDFFIITKDKRIYGIEVGRKKEIQSGSFSLRTAIPTASVDTENSRTSDRCPICLKWIQFCPYVIENYSNLNFHINNNEVRCLEVCDKYPRDQILHGKCPYSKYSRNKTKRDPRGIHEYATGLHYHYHCVLDNVNTTTKNIIIEGNDIIAIKTHFPYYQGIDDL